MAIANAMTAHEMGRSFVQMVRTEPAVRRLWLRRHRDTVELWLATQPTDAETERRLYASVASLHDRFPGANIRLHVLNPRFFHQHDLTELIPDGAEEIPLREP
jgi:hypothetical protein